VIVVVGGYDGDDTAFFGGTAVLSVGAAGDDGGGDAAFTVDDVQVHGVVHGRLSPSWRFLLLLKDSRIPGLVNCFQLDCYLAAASAVHSPV
jgi:hypothetical protein